MSGLGGWWRAVSYWTHEFFGENAYERYVAAWQEGQAAASQEGRAGDYGHDGRQPMTEREFFAHRLRVRYDTASPRC